jgi:hypothetical protein
MRLRRTKDHETEEMSARITEDSYNSEQVAGSMPRLVRHLEKMERDVLRDWEEIWNRYPLATRTDEESDIVDAEQLSINGYRQAIDEIRVFLKANGK